MGSTRVSQISIHAKSGSNTIGLIHREIFLIEAAAVGVNIMFGIGAVMSINEEESRLVLAKDPMSFILDQLHSNKLSERTLSANEGEVEESESALVTV